MLSEASELALWFHPRSKARLSSKNCKLMELMQQINVIILNNSESEGAKGMDRKERTKALVHGSTFVFLLYCKDIRDMSK